MSQVILNLAAIRARLSSWAASLQVPGAPYGTYRAAPGEEPDLYASVDMAILRSIVGEDFTVSLSSAQRQEWTEHINRFQSAEDGSYQTFTTHSKLHANGMVIGALGPLGGKMKYPVRLYEPFDTPEKAGPWLQEAVDWAKQWPASHLFWGGIHCFSQSRAATDEWKQAVFAWLDDNLDTKTGWWRKGIPHTDRNQPLGGSVHILPVYQHNNRPFPLPERVIDSTLALQYPNGSWMTPPGSPFQVHYLDLDALYALRYMGTLAPSHRTDDVKQAVHRFGAYVAGGWRSYEETVFARHPHWALAAVGALGLLNQFDPERYADDRPWSDIFGDIRFYDTNAVEV